MQPNTFTGQCIRSALSGRPWSSTITRRTIEFLKDLFDSNHVAGFVQRLKPLQDDVEARRRREPKCELRLRDRLVPPAARGEPQRQRPLSPWVISTVSQRPAASQAKSIALQRPRKSVERRFRPSNRPQTE
jgi:hypothetical protein